MGRNQSTTLARLPNQNCPHFCHPLLDLAAERREISGEGKAKEGKRTEGRVGERVREKKGPAHRQPIVLPQTQCALSLGSASVSATNQGSLSAGEGEKRCVPRKEEGEIGQQVPVPQKQIVLKQTQCAQSLASVSASATSQETRSVGGEGRVFVVQKVEPATRKALNKETLGMRVKSRGLVSLTLIVQPRILSALNLDSASVNATSLAMPSAGAKEIVCAVQTKEEEPDRKEERIKKKKLGMRKVHVAVMKIVQPMIQFALSLASVNVSVTNQVILSAGVRDRQSVVEEMSRKKRMLERKIKNRKTIPTKMQIIKEKIKKMFPKRMKLAMLIWRLLTKAKKVRQ